MGNTSKDLLHLEHKNPSSSPLESALFVCETESLSQNKKKPHPEGQPITTPVATSQVVGKVKDFLGMISEANKKLVLEAKDNSSEHYNIEVLTGSEPEYIEMNLMLGVADLHTPEAVVAAEAAIAGSQPIIPGAASSRAESDDSSDDGDSDGSDDEDDVNNGNDSSEDEVDHIKDCSAVKVERLRSGDDGLSRNHQSKKRPKIVEL
ncbi:uncharacterized protein LOC131163979 [Malania oleifera]|uniref:uncharacterized protein LOC131163979 n=1 Tax=Malania oleifera TaxID=397392 RepID=UPI0025AE71B5|nr:uncharacterized protein LOC131163979 [Malania oleifera]